MFCFFCIQLTQHHLALHFFGLIATFVQQPQSQCGGGESGSERVEISALSTQEIKEETLKTESTMCMNSKGAIRGERKDNLLGMHVIWFWENF